MQWLESLPDRRELGLGLFSSDARGEPAFYIEVVTLAVRNWIFRARAQALRHGCRHVEMRTHILVDAGEALRSNAHNAEVYTVDPQRVAENRGIRGEFAAPKIVGEHRDRIPARDSIFFSKKTAAECWFNSENLEEVAAHYERAAKMSAIVGRLGHAYP